MADTNYRLSLKFSEKNDEQKEAYNILKSKGRHKSEYIAKAVMFYVENADIIDIDNLQEKKYVIKNLMFKILTENKEDLKNLIKEVILENGYAVRTLSEDSISNVQPLTNNNQNSANNNSDSESVDEFDKTVQSEENQKAIEDMLVFMDAFG